VFDLLHLDGYDLRPLPLRLRRALLHTLLEHHTHDLFRYSESFAEDPQALLASVRALGWEGIIGKRADRPYQAGRSSDWIKLLARLRQDFIVAGVTRTRGTSNEIRTLLLGTYAADGTLRYVDSIEPTRRAPVRAEIARQITRLAQPTPAFRNPPRAAPEVDLVWLRPGVLVAEVSFLAWTRRGGLRHSTLQALRYKRAR
jgi:bifunctional non-homologous end joining protein LigD